MTEHDPAAPREPEDFRVAYVEGVTPGKWLSRWAERHRGLSLEATMVADLATADLVGQRVYDMAFVRQPFDRSGLHLIPLYEEQAVVVVPVDHVIADLDEVSVDDLQGFGLVGDPTDFGWHDVDVDPLPDLPPLTIAQRVETVAAGTGVTLLPQSVARLHHRKDVVARPVQDLAPTSVGLAWDEQHEHPSIELFIGIVRGRTERTSRGEQTPATPRTPKQRPTEKPRRTATKPGRPRKGAPRGKGRRS